MIVVGLVFAALLLLAFAGSALGEDGRSEPRVGALGCALFLLLLAGMVAKHQKAKAEDEF